MVEPLIPGGSPAAPRRPLLGYAMVWTAATLFAVNATVSKVILESGVSSPRLSQVRTTGALVGLMAWMIVLGTIVPFLLVVGALRHVSAPRLGIVAMLEPVVGAVVLTGILLAQTAR